MHDDRDSGRGTALLLAGIFAVLLGLGFAWWLAQPNLRVSQYERLGAEIGCPCGTCPLRPILTCGCGFADGMLVELRELIAEGHEDDAIVATFASRYDETIRIRPASSGLDLTAWAAPILLLTVGAVVVAGLIARWARSEGSAAGSEPPGAEPAPATAGDDDASARALVEREIEELDA